MSRSFGVEPAQPLARAGAAADSRRDGERSESDAGSWLEHQDQDSEAEERRLRETYESLLGLAKAGVVGADLPEEELAKGMVHVGLGPRGRGELRAFADFLRRACRGLTPSFDSFLRSVASGAEADAPEWHARGRRGSEVNTPEWSTHGRGDGSWRGREASSAGEARPSAELAALATWISSAPIGGEPLDELRAVLLEARSVASAAAAASRGHGEAAALRQVCAALAEALGRSDRLARDLATLEGEHARRQEDVARAMAARLRAQDKVLARRSEHLAALACAQRLRQRRRRGRLAPTASDEEPPGDGDALL